MDNSLKLLNRQHSWYTAQKPSVATLLRIMAAVWDQASMLIIRAKFMSRPMLA